jgi:hypothetical protein
MHLNMTTRSKVMYIIVGLVVIIQLVACLYVLMDARKQNERLKNIKDDVDKTVNYDSIVSASEKRILDSIRQVSESLEQYKEFQRNENKKLRRQHEELERRFRDIDTSDRPDF